MAQVSGQVHLGTNMSIPVLEPPLKAQEHLLSEVKPPVKPEVLEGQDGMDVEPAQESRRLADSKLAHSSPTPLPQTLFIGDLRLTALKSRLSSLAVPAEFAGEGMLICGPGVPTLLRGEKLGPGASASVVAVRKTAEGRIEMEGSIGDVYHVVRQALYANFAQVVM